MTDIGRCREILDAWDKGAARQEDLDELRKLLPAALEAAGPVPFSDVEDAFIAWCPVPATGDDTLRNLRLALRSAYYAGSQLGRAPR